MIVLTDNHLFAIPTQMGTVLIALVILGVTYVLMRQAPRILGRLGQPGAELMVRAMGMILAALSVELIQGGLASLFYSLLRPACFRSAFSFFGG